jgi:hypothetical protein
MIRFTSVPLSKLSKLIGTRVALIMEVEKARYTRFRLNTNRRNKSRCSERALKKFHSLLHFRHIASVA